jgi:hypothetical protein
MKRAPNSRFCLTMSGRSAIALALFFAFAADCAIHKVETSKALYEQARQAQGEGKDLQAIVYWKALLDQSEKEIRKGHYVATNSFLRASALFELGEWERGFAEIKQLHLELLRKEEFWIYPLYTVLLGDYYSQKDMPFVAQHFYESILGDSKFKNSSLYLLSLERKINNSIRAIQIQAEKKEDADKYKRKEYETLEKEVEKYLQDYPFSGVTHLLLADLLLKLGRADEALEHFIASLDLTLPTRDLKQSAEFEIASLLSNYTVSPRLKTVLLKRASDWWSKPDETSIFQAGENEAQWIAQQLGVNVQEVGSDPKAKRRYLALSSQGKFKILLWE